MEYKNFQYKVIKSEQEKSSIEIEYGYARRNRIVIPDEIKGIPVTSIGEYAFDNSQSARSITISNNVTNIGKSAFHDCQAEITIGSGVKNIGDQAFRWSNIDIKTLPDGLISIGREAFALTRSTSITIPASVTNIGDKAFYGCQSLATVTFEKDSQLTSLGKFVFAGCENLKEIYAPAHLAEQLKKRVS